MVNEISQNSQFKKTKLARTFAGKPLGFVDAGAMEGVHPLVEPVASLTAALCFEPHPVEYDKLGKLYRRRNPYAQVTIFPSALWSSQNARKTFYVTRKVNASSILPSKSEFIHRYGATNFEPAGKLMVNTVSLDSVLTRSEFKNTALGEFIKLDTQGSEYEILKGASRTLDSRTVAVWCEARFMETYRGEKLMADIEIHLRQKGFCLYGLYPHYRSTKSIDRRVAHTEERLMWADAIFFKDPLESAKISKRFTARQWEALILVAILTCFYDFAKELTVSHFKGEDRRQILRFVDSLARIDSALIAKQADGMRQAIRRDPRKSLLEAMRFSSQFRSNSDVDYLNS